MKTKFTCGLLFLLFTSAFISAQTEWAELRAEHVVVYFESKDEDFAKQVSRKAEEYYHSVASELGYVRYSNFWKWENRVKIYLYPDKQAYLKASNKPAWSYGMADYKDKLILSYVWNKDFLDLLLAHEIAHLVFRDFVGFKGEVPLWLDEGVAQWAETTLRQKRKDIINKLAKNKLLLSLSDIMNFDVRNVRDKDQIYIESTRLDSGEKAKLLLNGSKLVEIFYLQAFSLVDFFMEEYSADDFVFFCRQLRDGKSIEEALQFTYPTELRSLKQLEEKWLKYLQKVANR